MTEIGRKFDQDKLRYDLLPFRGMDEVVRVLTYGARKYAPDNWRHVPDADRRYIAAALRHISAYTQGLTLDEETDMHHLAHAICCLLFILTVDAEEEDGSTGD